MDVNSIIQFKDKDRTVVTKVPASIKNQDRKLVIRDDGCWHDLMYDDNETKEQDYKMIVDTLESIQLQEIRRIQYKNNPPLTTEGK